MPLKIYKKIDIDIEGTQTVQGLLLAAWIADRLNWKLESSISSKKDQLKVNFLRPDKILVQVGITSLPIGKPSINPGQIVGLRLIAKANNKQKKRYLCNPRIRIWRMHEIRSGRDGKNGTY